MALHAMFWVSERLACKLVGQQCRTQRNTNKVVEIEGVKLRQRVREIQAEHPLERADGIPCIAVRGLKGFRSS